MESNIRKAVISTVAAATIVGGVSAPAFADETPIQEDGNAIQDAQTHLPTVAADSPDPTQFTAPTSARPDLDQAQADQAAADQSYQKAQEAVNAAQQSADRADAQLQQSQQAKDQSEAGASQARQNVNQAQSDYDQAADATQTDVDQAQSAKDKAQADYDQTRKDAADAQAKLDKAETDKTTAEQAQTEFGRQLQQAETERNQAQADKAKADQEVTAAQKKYDQAVSGKNDNLDQATKNLAKAKADQAAAKDDYASKEQAVTAASKSLDEAQKALDQAKNNASASHTASEGVAGFFQSIMNDPAASDAVKADAKSAYEIIVENSYKASWFDKVDVSDKNDAASIQGLKNAITYFDAVNAIRRENNVNELGVNLTAMATAMLNCSYSGQVSFNHSGYITGYENLASGSGPYTGSNNPEDWENGEYGWPFTGWYTAEKHAAENGAPYYEVGHYLNFVAPGVQSMGFGTGDGVTIWEGNGEASSYSVDDFKQLVENYSKALESSSSSAADVQKAQKAYDKAKSENERAQAELQAAKQKLDAAQKALDQAVKAYETAQQTAADAHATLQERQTAMSEAKKKLDQANKTLDDVRKALAVGNASKPDPNGRLDPDFSQDADAGRQQDDIDSTTDNDDTNLTDPTVPIPAAARTKHASSNTGVHQSGNDAPLASTGADTTAALGLLAIMTLVGTGCVLARVHAGDER